MMRIGIGDDSVATVLCRNDDIELATMPVDTYSDDGDDDNTTTVHTHDNAGET